MPRPNSLTTRVRHRLVKWLEPMPDVHEAWCLDCVLNNSRTLVLPASAIYPHVQRHREGGPGAHLVRLKTRASENDLP